VTGRMRRRSLPHRMHPPVPQRHYQQVFILVGSLTSRVEHQVGHRFRLMYRTLQAARAVTTAVPKDPSHHHQLVRDLRPVPEDPGMLVTLSVPSITY
jgi:hypothetical protein